MKTSVIGFPRIGADRELKKISEAFFAGKATEDEVQAVARAIRAEGWRLQTEAGISYIPSGDFSFYDNLLDVAFALGAVPGRYRALDLSPLATYFAMARGYQGGKGDVKALPMKKWFNTNYHYIVPELDDAMALKFDIAKWQDEYEEAKALGVETVPTVVGPYTFLKLARYTGAKKAADYVAAIGDAYANFVYDMRLATGAKRFSFAEPALVLDTTSEDLNMLIAIYAPVMKAAHRQADGDVFARIALQTYFGDLRDSWRVVKEVGFDAIGLDFVEVR